MREKSRKRSKADLYATILEVIKSHPEGARITRISYGVGVPVDRLKEMVDSLASYGLLVTITEDDETFFGVTPRGIEFLDIYWRMNGFLASFDERSI